MTQCKKNAYAQKRRIFLCPLEIVLHNNRTIKIASRRCSPHCLPISSIWRKVLKEIKEATASFKKEQPKFKTQQRFQKTYWKHCRVLKTCRVFFWSDEIVTEWEYLVNVLNAMELYTFLKRVVGERTPPSCLPVLASQLEQSPAGKPWPLRSPGTSDKGRHKLSFLTLSAS